VEGGDRSGAFNHNECDTNRVPLACSEQGGP
jgi:hypothetical protein